MISFELFMLENVFVIVISDFVEVIHIELSYKWTEISVSKMYRENFLFKSLYVNDNKICSFFVPRDDVFVLIVLSQISVYLKDLVGFRNEDWRARSFLFFPFDFLTWFSEFFGRLEFFGSSLFAKHLLFRWYLKLIIFFHVFKVDY